MHNPNPQPTGRPEWEAGTLKPHQAKGVAADALADLAVAHAISLEKTPQEISRSHVYLSQVENILYVATGNRYLVTLHE